MPSYYKGRRSFSIWIDEDLLEEVAYMAKEMGYGSLSEFYGGFTREIVASYKAARKLGLKGQKQSHSYSSM